MHELEQTNGLEADDATVILSHTRMKRTFTGHVLLVDDDADVLDITARILRATGLVVDVATDGEQAWSALCGGSYDLLITDHNMPRLTGVDLIKRMRAGPHEIPSMIISGGLPFDDENTPLIPQAGSFLSKPFSPSQLLDQVGGLLHTSVPLAKAS